LENFAYRLTISLWVYVSSASILLIIGLLTISHQTIKAANTNPVDVLRNE
jgi:putative ABC transport system permease protein